LLSIEFINAAIWLMLGFFASLARMNKIQKNFCKQFFFLQTKEFLFEIKVSEKDKDKNEIYWPPLINMIRSVEIE